MQPTSLTPLDDELTDAVEDARHMLDTDEQPTIVRDEYVNRDEGPVRVTVLDFHEPAMRMIAERHFLASHARWTRHPL